MVILELTIINKLGLHARAAAKLVGEASRFSSSVTLTVNERQVDGKSIMSVMLLAASQGSPIQLSIEGPDELDAAAALENLINRRFDEAE